MTMSLYCHPCGRLQVLNLSRNALEPAHVPWRELTSLVRLHTLYLDGNPALGALATQIEGDPVAVQALLARGAAAATLLGAWVHIRGDSSIIQGYLPKIPM